MATTLGTQHGTNLEDTDEAKLLGRFATQQGTNLFTDLLTSKVCLMLDWDDRKALAATSSGMYNLLYAHFPFYSANKESFVIHYRKNRKRRFNHLDYAHANTCRSLIVTVNGPSLHYEENPTQDPERERTKTWNMLRVLTAPQYANKITELTFNRVDLLAANIFAQSKMVDFPTLSRLRILNCREFDLTNVSDHDWNFLAERGIEVVYHWEYTRIPRTHSHAAGAILARMFKWRLAKSDAGKKAFFDNLLSNRQFRAYMDRAFRGHWVPGAGDPGFRTADDFHSVVFKEDKTWELSKAANHTIHGFFSSYSGSLTRNYECRDCDVEMTGVCFPKAQIHGQQSETPLCYYCKYQEDLYSVAAATSSQTSAVPFNYSTGEISSVPLSLAQVVMRALDMKERPSIKRPLNTMFNQMCPLLLNSMPCPHQRHKACILNDSYVSLYLYSSNTWLIFEQRSDARVLQGLPTPSTHLIKSCTQKLKFGVCSTENAEGEKKKCPFGHDFWEERTFLWQKDVQEYHTKWNA